MCTSCVSLSQAGAKPAPCCSDDALVCALASLLKMKKRKFVAPWCLLQLWHSNRSWTSVAESYRNPPHGVALLPVSSKAKSCSRPWLSLTLTLICRDSFLHWLRLCFAAIKRRLSPAVSQRWRRETGARRGPAWGRGGWGTCPSVLWI